MTKYYVLFRDHTAMGPFINYSMAENQAVLNDGIVVKECLKENQLGAPDIYPFNTEDYPDGEEG